MLAIRMQRTGRKGHANFRVVVQDSRLTPTSGKVVASIGSYDPHSKAATLEKEKAEFYLKNGAQPSNRVIRLFLQEGIKLPTWAVVAPDKASKIRNPEKLRRNRPAEAKAPVAENPAEAEEPVEATEVAKEEAPVENTGEEVAATEEPATEEVATEETTPEPSDEA